MEERPVGVSPPPLQRDATTAALARRRELLGRGVLTATSFPRKTTHPPRGRRSAQNQRRTERLQNRKQQRRREMPPLSSYFRIVRLKQKKNDHHLGQGGREDVALAVVRRLGATAAHVDGRRVLDDDVFDAHAADEDLREFGGRGALEHEGEVADDDRGVIEREAHGVLRDPRARDVDVDLEVVVGAVVPLREFIAQQRRHLADGSLDDEGRVDAARDELERVVAPLVQVLVARGRRRRLG
eukprot:CAMPEP_0185706030 /NCGR_PEP_ID=MMETSP1164-20130828/21059_1 /TAXON_ID=1104430 /ORGANISM="Chrysoreinhardia sp, Strain CCMP2950" /LENGTH=240 /DNA_ID=CAMNT_0028373427 /DNA_START=79 /DNA_END=798 /DNA_ORIENTATION=-